MKNLLQNALVATVATISLSVFAAGMEPARVEPGKPGEVMTKDRIEPTKFDAGNLTGDAVMKNVQNLIPDGHPIARQALLEGLQAKSPEADTVAAGLASMDAKVRKNTLAQLDKKIALSMVAASLASVTKPSVPQVKPIINQVACGDSPEALLAFEQGVDSATVSEFEAAETASKAVVQGGAWSNGACGLNAQEEGGSSAYELPARVALMKLIIGEKACGFTKACAISVFAKMKSMAESAAAPIIAKFGDKCKIHRFAPVAAR